MLSPSKRLLKLIKGLLKIFNGMLKHDIYPNLLEFGTYKASKKNVFAPWVDAQNYRTRYMLWTLRDYICLTFYCLNA